MTVAICTHAGSERIEPALRSVLEQSPAADEIVVLDSAPPDGRTEEIVRTRFPRVRYEVEPVLGLDFARNAVLERASHPIVAFLDDDAVAMCGWVGKLRSAFARNPRLVVCCSRVTALRLDTEARRLFEANGGLDRGPDPVRLPQDARRVINGFSGSRVAWATRIAVGCGMAVRRKEALALGGFDPALDLGFALPGGGDCDMLWRAIEAGHEAEYLPDSTILHDHREWLDDAVRQITGHQKALVALLTKVVRNSRGASRRSALQFLGWRLVKPGTRMCMRLLGKDPLPMAILARMWWASWVGLFAYPAAQRVARARMAGSGPASELPGGVRT